jgi:hypothetical protein
VNRDRVILGALLGVLALCLVYAFLATPRLDKAPPRAAGRHTQPLAQQSAEGNQATARGRIDFTYLAEEPQAFAGGQRDIFSFGQRRPAKPATVPTPRAVERPVAQLVAPKEVVPIDAVRRSLGQFTFLGFLEKAGAKTVFLTSGGELFLAKQGEHFGTGREFQVEAIDDKFLKVRHAGREGLIEVELIEKQKLSAAVSAPASISRPAGPAAPMENGRVLRSLRRTARPVALPVDGQAEVPEEIQGDDNAWPETRHEGMIETYNPDALQEPGNPVD